MEYVFANMTACNQETDELSCLNSLSNCAWNEEVYEDNAGTAADPDSASAGYMQPFESSTSIECVYNPLKKGAAIPNSQPAADAIRLVLECALRGLTPNECSGLRKKGCAWDGSHCKPNSTMGVFNFMHRASKTPFTRALVTEHAECSARETKDACVLASEVAEISPAILQQNLARAESGKPAPKEVLPQIPTAVGTHAEPLTSVKPNASVPLTGPPNGTTSSLGSPLGNINSSSIAALEAALAQSPAPSSSPAPAVISSVSVAPPMSHNNSGYVAKVTGNSILCIVLLGIAIMA